MIDALLGSVLGLAGRAIPEVLSWLDKKNERKHELLMQNAALEFEKVRGAQKMLEIGAQSDQAWNTGAIEALKEGIRAQGEKTGTWADIVSTLVRPVITFWFMFLYSFAKVAVFWGAIDDGVAWTEAYKLIWTEGDLALWAAILNFWFLGRVFDKIRGR